MTLSIERLRELFDENQQERPPAFEDVTHPEWNMIVNYIVDTTDYNPKHNSYSSGIELIQAESIPLCAHLSTEDWFSQEAWDTVDDMAEEFKLGELEPGFYRCVCGISVNGSEWTSHEGVTEYDTEVYHEMISRTKLTHAEGQHYIKANEYHPPEDEDVKLAT